MNVLARISRLRRVFSALAVLAGLVLAAGCAELTARHLESRNWNPSAEQTLTMRHWRFTFVSVPTRQSYGIKGSATALADTLPAWVPGAGIDLTAYLRDAEGVVLATDQKTYLPMSLTDASAVSFDFFLAPNPGARYHLSVSFGYRAVFTSDSACARGRGQAPGAVRVFSRRVGLMRE
jgi:hypothetical protein